MSSTHKYAAPNSVESALTTELNSLAAGTVALSAAIDNTAGLYKFADVETYIDLTISAGDYYALFLVEAVDGTNYEDAVTSSGETLLAAAQLMGSLRHYHTGAERHVLRGVPLPPLKFKVAFLQYGSSNLASSGNTVRLRRYYEADV